MGRPAMGELCRWRGGDVIDLGSAERVDLRDRVGGSFYGLLVGDALGCPAEGCTPRQVEEMFGHLAGMQQPKTRCVCG